MGTLGEQWDGARLKKILDFVKIKWANTEGGRWVESEDQRSHVSVYQYVHTGDWHVDAVLWVGPIHNEPWQKGWFSGKLDLSYRVQDPEQAKEILKNLVEWTKTQEEE